MKSPVLYIGLGVVALLVVVGAGAGTAFLVMKNMPAPEQKVLALAAPGIVDPEKTKAVPLKEFKTHLADTTPRYVAISFELVAKDDKDVEKIKTYTASIRDNIVVILNSKKSSELTGEHLGKLKSEVQEKVNNLMGGHYLLQVLITDIVVQF